MAEQSAASHFHHPVPTYLVAFFAMLTLAIVFGGQPDWSWHSRDVAIISLAFGVIVLGSISRTYTVKLQDRIIMLEMKVRCAELLPAGQDAALSKLRPKQIVALRFAGDEELGALLDRAVREDLKPSEIKAAIKTWRPDPHRT
jgi:hypothetical protein